MPSSALKSRHFWHKLFIDNVAYTYVLIYMNHKSSSHTNWYVTLHINTVSIWDLLCLQKVSKILN